MGRKKEIATAGRFGPRYGKRIRASVSEIEKIQRQKHICPKCNMPYVKRISKGIWKCKKCGTKFAGLAFVPQM
ncbi:MAG: 50S ribosomal protein L37ae [Candidatus Aenigmatarchaeota archaeon]